MYEEATQFSKFLSFMAKKAQEQEQGAHYALGYKSVGIPITAALLNEFDSNNHFENDAQAREWAKEQGFLSEAGAKSGVFECRVVFPDYSKESPNTASTIQLAREIGSHLSLCVNAMIKSHRLTDEQKIDIQKHLEAVTVELEREVLIEQIAWLGEKNRRPLSPELYSAYMKLGNNELAGIASTEFAQYIENQPDGQSIFNHFLAERRLVVADNYREKLFNRMINSPEFSNVTFETEMLLKHLKSTPSTISDSLFQNSASGQFYSLTGTESVAHNKLAGNDAVAAIRVFMASGDVVWRVPSIAATDQMKKEKKSTKTTLFGKKESPKKTNFIHDTRDKLKNLSDKITKKENLGDPDGLVYYNLLTSYGCISAADNQQSWSTEMIVHGVHLANHSKIKEGKINLIMLANFSVNQWGEKKPDPPRPREEREMIDEIHDMADLAVIQALSSVLDKDAALGSLAENTLENYTDFVLNNEDETALYTHSKKSDDQRALIEKFRENPLEIKPNKDDTPRQLAAKVLYKMFHNQTYSEQKYGMMVQSLLLIVERNKMSGCKSANERFASVIDQAAGAHDPRLVSAIDTYLNSSGPGAEDILYESMLEVYNTSNLYEGPGQACSIADQGATAKTEHYKEKLVPGIPFVQDEVQRGSTSSSDPDSDSDEYIQVSQPKDGRHVNRTFNTNAFLSPLVTNMVQKFASKLQAHKVGARVEKTLNALISKFGNRAGVSSPQQPVSTEPSQNITPDQYTENQQQAIHTLDNLAKALQFYKIEKVTTRSPERRSSGTFNKALTSMKKTARSLVGTDAATKDKKIDDALEKIQDLKNTIQSHEDPTEDANKLCETIRNDLSSISEGLSNALTSAPESTSNVKNSN